MAFHGVYAGSTAVFFAMTSLVLAESTTIYVAGNESVLIERSIPFAEVEVSDPSMATIVKLSDRHVLITALDSGEAVMYFLSSDGQLTDSHVLKIGTEGDLFPKVVETRQAR